MTVQEAIDLTVERHNYSKSQEQELRKRLLRGDFTVITRYNSARDKIQILPFSEIQKEIATYANLEDTIDDILNNSDISIELQKEYVIHQFLKFWQKDTPYVLNNGSIFTFQELKNYMIKGILSDANNIKLKNNRNSINDLSAPIKNESDALQIVEWCKEDPERLDKAINKNESLSGILLRHALDYYYFEKKNDNNIDIIIEIANNNQISPIELISNILLDESHMLLYNLPFEERKKLSEIDKNQIKIEILTNSIKLYRYSKAKSGSSIENIIYGGNEYQNSHIVHENIIKNNLFVNSLINLDIQELKERIVNLSYTDLIGLTKLYINCYKNDKAKSILIESESMTEYPGTIHLENTLKSKEFREKLTSGRRY